jgi:hypothetical protein
MQITSLSGTFHRTASDSHHFYVVGTEGVVVIRSSDSKEIAHATVSGLTDVSLGETMVFLASSSGVLFFEKIQIYEGNFTSKVFYHSSEPNLISNDVQSVDSLGNELILAGTVSGVTLYSGGDYYSSSEVEGVRAVHLAGDSSVYYGGDFGLAAKRTTITGTWTADYILNSTTVPPVFPVNSIDSVQDEGGRLLGLATTSGVLLIKEEEIIENSDITQLLKS